MAVISPGTITVNIPTVPASGNLFEVVYFTAFTNSAPSLAADNIFVSTPFPKYTIVDLDRSQPDVSWR